MYCRYCGNLLDEEDAFCPKCGKPISKDMVIPSGVTQIDYKEQILCDDDLLESEFEELFVGKNNDYYINKWNKLKSKNSKISWNWAAFFLGPFWFGYRKMYIPVVFIAVIYFLVDFSFYLIQYQFSEETYLFDPIQNLLLFPLTILLSLFGNYYYIKHTNKNIDKLKLQPYNLEQKRTWLKRKGGTSWLGVAITLVIIFLYGIVSAFLLPTNIDQISVVKDGSFYEYPTTTIGEGFNDFFAEHHWEYVSSNSPFDVIRFTGIADQAGKDVEVIIDFVLTDNSFEIHSSKVNGVVISDDEINSLLDMIFTSNESNIVN